MGFRVRDIEIKNRVVLAPMAGICNSAFRRICKEMGCGLIYAEMVSDKAITYGNRKTIDMLSMTDMERPIVQQIFGSDVDSFVEAALYIECEMKPDIIDINMGCPVPKVAVRAQAGSALLKDPSKIYDIVSSVVSAVSTPVSVKIRSGWDKEHINAVEVAKVCEMAGASLITVHPRTRSEGYSGKADWNIKSPEDALRMLNETGCDAVMIGRGVLGNPWLISNTLSYLEYGHYTLPSARDKILMCIKHLNYLSELKSEKQVVLEIRNHIGWYLKGITGASSIKNKIYQCSKIHDILSILNEFLLEVDDGE